MLGLRMIDGVSKKQFEEKYKMNLNKVFMREIEKLKKQDLIVEEEENIKLTNKGIDLANLVWQEFV